MLTYLKPIAKHATVGLMLLALCSCVIGRDDNEQLASTDSLPLSSETLKLADPQSASIAAVRKDAAMVVTHKRASYGSIESAAFVQKDGTVAKVSLSSDLSGQLLGVQPIATKTGFAIVGYLCEDDRSAQDDSCLSLSGVATFYDSEGTQIAVSRTPPILGVDALSTAPGDGDSVMVVGGEVWTLSLDDAVKMDSPVTDAICGIPDHGVYAIEPRVGDRDAPEDTLLGFDVMSAQGSGKWSSVHSIDIEDAHRSRASWPFCTPQGIVVSDYLYNGDSMVPLRGGDLNLEIDDRHSVGVARDGTVLQRRLAVAGAVTGEAELSFPAWLGLSSDGTVALRTTGTSWEFAGASRMSGV